MTRWVECHPYRHALRSARLRQDDRNQPPVFYGPIAAVWEHVEVYHHRPAAVMVVVEHEMIEVSQWRLLGIAQCKVLVAAIDDVVLMNIRR